MITTKTQVTFTATVQLTEAEARVLAALPLYGTDKFLEMFYTHLGKAYLQPQIKPVTNIPTILDGIF